MAIWFGLLEPSIDIAAITTVWGNVPVETCTTNALRILEMAGHADIPVAAGARGPLDGSHPPMGERVHGADGQGNTDLPAPRLRATDESAVDLLIRLAREEPGELTLVPIGPLTNVALALQQDPTIAELYRQVILMGGAFLAPGNVTAVAEANIWHDPEAAQVVLDASWPITIVGLDVTNRALLTDVRLEGLRDTTAGDHLYAITQHYLALYASRSGRRECSMHDPLALAIAADPSLALAAPTAQVHVELKGEHTRGMTVADLRSGRRDVADANARVVLEADSARFLDWWTSTIKGV